MAGHVSNSLETLLRVLLPRVLLHVLLHVHVDHDENAEESLLQTFHSHLLVSPIN